MNRGSGAFGFAEADLQQIQRTTFVRTVEHSPGDPVDQHASAQLGGGFHARTPGPGIDRCADRRTRPRDESLVVCSRGIDFLPHPPAGHPDRGSVLAVDLIDRWIGCVRLAATTAARSGNRLEMAQRRVRPIAENLRYPGGGSPRSPDRLVVGIGINVNNSLTQAPQPVAATAISLMDVAGYSFDLTIVLVRVLHQLANQLAALARADVTLASRWQELCMLSGRRVQVEAGQRTTVGMCQGIDESGACWSIHRWAASDASAESSLCLVSSDRLMANIPCEMTEEPAAARWQTRQCFVTA